MNAELQTDTLRDVADRLGHRLTELRSTTSRAPDLSLVIPVNVQGDLENLAKLLAQVCDYHGPYAIEIVLVINNFDEESFQEVCGVDVPGTKTIFVKSARRPGEAVAFSARMVGVRMASSPFFVTTDADCKFVNVNSWIDWYVQRFSNGCAAAYGPIEFFDVSHCSVAARIQIHHFGRWIKRCILRIPTTMGANYGAQRELVLELYDRGLLADEMNVGPAVKRSGGIVEYSGSEHQMILTSSRMYRPGWFRIFPYLLRRLKYNLKVLSARSEVARRTGRENDPTRRFVDNKPIR